jgi:hypothetical protein
MTLDVYADLFDDDLDAVADRLDHGLAQTSVGKMWARPVSKGCVAEKIGLSSGIYLSRESGPRGARTHDPRNIRGLISRRLATSQIRLFSGVGALRLSRTVA